MNTKQKIHMLLDSIKSDVGIDETIKKKKVALIEKLLESANRYIEIVVRQGVLLQVNEGTNDRDILEDFAGMDKSRSRIHDSLISQIAIVNRLCTEYKVENIYNGKEERRYKGDFALELITDYFRDRI